MHTGSGPMTTMAGDLLDSCAALFTRSGDEALAEGAALLGDAGIHQHERTLAAFAVIFGVGRAFGSGGLTSDAAYDRFNRDWVVAFDDDWPAGDHLFELFERMREAVAMAEPTEHDAKENPGWLDIDDSRRQVRLLTRKLEGAWIALVSDFLGSGAPEGPDAPRRD